MQNRICMDFFLTEGKEKAPFQEPHFLQQRLNLSFILFWSRWRSAEAAVNYSKPNQSQKRAKEKSLTI